MKDMKTMKRISLTKREWSRSLIEEEIEMAFRGLVFIPLSRAEHRRWGRRERVGLFESVVA